VERLAQRRDVGGEGAEELLGGEGKKGGYRVSTKEEYAGWEAVSVETWTRGLDGSVWCAGGEGGIRRY
jgi:proteasomal ATPase-associated factor 1